MTAILKKTQEIRLVFGRNKLLPCLKLTASSLPANRPNPEKDFGKHSNAIHFQGAKMLVFKEGYIYGYHAGKKVLHQSTEGVVCLIHFKESISWYIYPKKRKNL